MYTMEDPQEKCVIEVYNLWFRMFAKALNDHEIDDKVNRTFDGDMVVEEKIEYGAVGVNWT